MMTGGYMLLPCLSCYSGIMTRIAMVPIVLSVLAGAVIGVTEHNRLLFAPMVCGLIVALILFYYRRRVDEEQGPRIDRYIRVFIFISLYGLCIFYFFFFFESEVSRVRSASPEFILNQTSSTQ